MENLLSKKDKGVKMSKLPFERIKRSILIKNEEETDPSYGCDPSKRSIEELMKRGVICINKPEGPTSFIVSDHVKRILNASKTSHGGTLE